MAIVAWSLGEGGLGVRRHWATLGVLSSCCQVGLGLRSLSNLPALVKESNHPFRQVARDTSWSTFIDICQVARTEEQRMRRTRRRCPGVVIGRAERLVGETWRLRDAQGDGIDDTNLDLSTRLATKFQTEAQQDLGGEYAGAFFLVSDVLDKLGP